MELPRDYLSYSAISLFWKNKEQFRQRYYLNEKIPDTRYTLYGREVHKVLEEDTGLKTIPRLKHPEYPISVEISDVPIYGIIDSFGATRRSFIDYKSGIRKEDGSPRWTQVEVEKLDQLPFYATLIQEKFGKVHPVCKLVWLETAWNKIKEKVGSMEIDGEGNILGLTGHYEVFKREIYPQEIKRMKEWIGESANLISNDYTEWKKTNKRCHVLPREEALGRSVKRRTESVRKENIK